MSNYYFLNQNNEIELAQLKMVMEQQKPRRKFIVNEKGEVKIEKPKRKLSKEYQDLIKKKQMLDELYG
jgi:hypothetical protein